MTIVHLLDEGADRISCVLRIAVGLAVDLLLLEGLHEALCPGIVVRIAHPAHACGNAMPLQQFSVVAAGVLDAAIGVVDQAVGLWPARRHRHRERSGCQPRLQMRFQGPADHAPAEGIEHDREIDELFLQPDVGNVGYPELVEAARHHAAGQVRHHAPAMARVCRNRHERLLSQA